MMGSSHVWTGWIAGSLFAQLVLGLPPAATVTFGSVAAGASATNDLDHDNASASRVLGPLSGALANGVQAYAKVLYAVTRGPGDPPDRSAHRGATHALPLLPIPCLFLAVLPWIVSTATWHLATWCQASPWLADQLAYWAGPASVAAVIGFCLLIVADRLGGKATAVTAGAFAAMGVGHEPDELVAGAADALVAAAPWVALAVLVGTVVHCAGDAVTEFGGYWLAPVLRRNRGTTEEQRWVRLQLPKWLAFKTGKWFELRIVRPLLLWPGAVLVFPGVWSAAWPLITQLFT